MRNSQHSCPHVYVCASSLTIAAAVAIAASVDVDVDVVLSLRCTEKTRPDDNEMQNKEKQIRRAIHVCVWASRVHLHSNQDLQPRRCLDACGPSNCTPALHTHTHVHMYIRVCVHDVCCELLFGRLEKNNLSKFSGRVEFVVVSLKLVSAVVCVVFVCSRLFFVFSYSQELYARVAARCDVASSSLATQ